MKTVQTSHYDNTEHSNTAAAFIENVDKYRPKHNKMSNLEKDAAYFAYQKHAGQYRKYGLENYIVHPAEVASILSQVTSVESILAAAWLHDVVEDCGVTLEELAIRFGFPVMGLVSQVSNPSQLIPEYSKLPRKERKEIDIEYACAAGPLAKMIKLADIYSNMHSITCNDPGFAKIWVKEKEQFIASCDEHRFMIPNFNKLYLSVSCQLESSKRLLEIA